MQLYPIAVRSRQHLLDLDIRQSFRQFPDVFIQIHSMEDGAVTALRRTALTRAHSTLRSQRQLQSASAALCRCRHCHKRWNTARRSTKPARCSSRF